MAKGKKLGRLLLFAAAGLLLFGGAYYLYRNRTRHIVPEGKPSVDIYVTRQPSPEFIGKNYSGAKYEPKYGCYLGAYIDLDPYLKTTVRDGSNRERKLPAEFEEIVKKRHAAYVIYQHYKALRLPVKWLKRLASEDRFVQIALEPNTGLDPVKDDEHLRELADELKASGAKVFLRFAAEMNGDWVKYHGDPKKYIEKWRLVAKVMRERAPNVAMVWCPYWAPQRLIDEYYPGDEWVDWVGLNMYSVTYYNQDKRFPGLDDHPVDLLQQVYDKYSKTKPIMICEYAATNYSAFDDRSVEDFASQCIRSFYWSLPRRFPRVKLVSYFSANNMLIEYRRNNNYSVLKSPEVRDAYRTAIADPYFLSKPGQIAPYGPLQLTYGTSLRPDEQISIWARSPGRIVEIEVLLNGKVVLKRKAIGGFAFPLSDLPGFSGRASLEARVMKDGEVVAGKSVQVTMAKASEPSPPP